MRARGLKLGNTSWTQVAAVVAPHAGAWIETYQAFTLGTVTLRRAPCGRVD